MPHSRILITFYSRCGATERLALAAAVGAVEARASIRLRRLPDLATKSERDLAISECREAFRRMQREYVRPTESDLVWADGVVFGLPPHFRASSEEWMWYRALLGRLADEGNLDRKVATVLRSASDGDGAVPLEAAIVELGFHPLEPSSSPVADGLEGVDVAKSLGQRTAEWASEFAKSSSP